jgi:hypothetical protein
VWKEKKEALNSVRSTFTINKKNLQKKNIQENKEIGNNENDAENNEAEPSINIIKKASKRKITSQRTTKGTISVAQKTRKLNPQPNLVARAKSLEILENAVEDYLTSQEKKVKETKNMKSKRATPLPVITTTNRYSILATEPDPQPHPGPSNYSSSSINPRNKKEKWNTSW